MRGILQEPDPNDCATCGGQMEVEWVLTTTDERFCWECAAARISLELDAPEDERARQLADQTGAKAPKKHSLPPHGELPQ